MICKVFFAVARTVVNNDGKGGYALDPLVRSSGALSKKTRIDLLALLHFGLLDGKPDLASSSLLTMLQRGLTLMKF